MTALNTDFQCRENSLLLEEDATMTLVAREEKSATGFKTLKDRLTLLSGANTAGDIS